MRFLLLNFFFKYPLNDESRKKKINKPTEITSSQVNILRKLAQERMIECFSIKDVNGWHLDKNNKLGTISTNSSDKYGRMYKYEGEFNTDPTSLVKLLRAETVTQWNPAIKYFKVVEKVDPEVDVTHAVTYEPLGGMVSAREFVTLRCFSSQGSSYIQSFSSIDHPDIPQSSKVVRGIQGPSMYIISPIAGDPNKSRLEWFQIVDLKGWLPKATVNLSVSSTMLDTISGFKEYVKEETSSK